MSQENVELVRAIHEAISRGESPASLGLLHPDIEWVNPGSAVEPGTHRGLDSFAGAFAALGDAFDRVQIEPHDFVDAGDHVVVLATFTAWGRASGLERRNEDGYVWTVRDGRAVVFRWFNDQAEALKAAGLDG
jgi:ketosteroid isomerase-like protein